MRPEGRLRKEISSKCPRKSIRLEREYKYIKHWAINLLTANTQRLKSDLARVYPPPVLNGSTTNNSIMGGGKLRTFFFFAFHIMTSITHNRKGCAWHLRCGELQTHSHISASSYALRAKLRPAT